MTDPYDHMEKIEQALQKNGGLYNFSDIIRCLERGEMQMFAEGDSLAITKVADFPRKRLLDIVLVYGELEEVLRLQHRVYAYALDVNADLIAATLGRRGWEKQMYEGDGWKIAGAVYLKDMKT